MHEAASSAGQQQRETRVVFVWVLGALLAIVVFAIVINRITGTKAHYLEALQLETGEAELWRDAEADFATVPRLGRAAIMSYPRLRRHTVLWTDRRIVVAQKALGTSKHMITHQIYFAPDAGAQTAAGAPSVDSTGAASRPIVAAAKSFGQVNHKDCARIKPTKPAAQLNLDEALIFTERLPNSSHACPDTLLLAPLLFSFALVLGPGGIALRVDQRRAISSGSARCRVIISGRGAAP